MTPRTVEIRDRSTRWGGMLVSVGAALIIVAVVLYLTSGAVAPPGATPAESADALMNAPGQVALMAYLSVPANFALLLGAVLLATRPLDRTGALLARAAWSVVAVASLLVVQFDLLLPHAILPLAAGYAEAPLVFEALYRASNYVHSVGLFLTFASFVALFALEARRADRVLPRSLALTGVVAWSLGLVVAASLIAERPLVMIAPAILLGWLLVTVLGFRTARTAAGPTSADGAEPAPARG